MVSPRESLQELGLGYVAEDLEKRGIVIDEAAPAKDAQEGNKLQVVSDMAEKIKKKIKTIKVDVDKCNGCRGCEVICSAFHAEPKIQQQ